MTIATKDQERKALAKIKKIVEELGEGSYLAMTFEGCWDMAEDNITNDFGNSWYDAAQHEAKESYKKDEEIRNLKAQVKELQAAHDKDEEYYKEQMAAGDTNSKMLAEKVDRLEEKLLDSNECARHNWELYSNLQAENEKLQQEVIELKAKLYDLLVK